MGFVAGTLVHTDKGLVPIEWLKVGDFHTYYVGQAGMLVAAQK